MKERPILFSTEMVQAILAGRKTQTRRVIQPQPPVPECSYTQLLNKCRYGQPGDILWVRESFNYSGISELAPDEFYIETGVRCAFVYKADNPHTTHPDHPEWGKMKWKPSIHMPKVAARIWLQVTDVRVERLHDISEEDAIAEGIESFRPVPGDGPAETLYFHYTKNKWGPSPVHSFQTLIQKINGADIWDHNPWVWAVSFRILSTTGRPSNLEELCAAS